MASSFFQIPIVMKREEVFQHLFEHNVTLVRACWYIKMLALYNGANNDSKQKKKTTASDPFIDWTRSTIATLDEVFDRLMKETLQSQRTTPIPDIINNHLNDLNPDGHNLSLNSGSATPQYAPSTPQMHHPSPSNHLPGDRTRRQWDYYIRLLRMLFDQGLLDRQIVVEWVVEAFISRIKHNDDLHLRYIIPVLFQFSSEILEYEIFSRKVAFYCCKRLGQYHSDPNQPANFTALLSCPQHRLIIYSLSAVIQCITLRCPAALLYNNPIDDQQKSDVLLLNSGSPLDFLPCAPSQLPIAIGLDQNLVRQMLIQAEEDIRSRSLAIEHKWSTEKLQQSISGQTITRVLSVLEILDEFKEDKYPLDNVYNKIYSNAYRTDFTINEIEIEVIHLMCDWAITTRRHGVYRAFFVARLLERRQIEFKNHRAQEAPATTSAENTDEKENVANPSPYPIHPFQHALTEYLLKKAPYIDSTQVTDPELSASFASLVMLFSELIRLNLFSPMQFMCNLIAHGLVPSSQENHENHQQFNVNPSTIYRSQSIIRTDPFHSESTFDRRTSTNFADFDPFETLHPSPSTTPKTLMRQGSKIDFNRTQPINAEESHNQQRTRKRCLLYLEQFPYPLEDDFRDEFNQRKIMLFGISSKR